MCGIGGVVSFDRRPDGDIAERMTECMRHRGPDASGVLSDGPVLLAHRRLSVLDPTESGNQPMSSPDGQVHVVFNGEIYNYRELREELTDYRFESQTDTEVLLHLYREDGVECLERLRGMFAFAIWDESSQRVFLARDRLGQKPLYFRTEGQTLWFGSTIRAILADPRVPVAPDHSAIREYLTYQYVPDPLTGFDGIHQLRPARYMLFDSDGIETDRYWSLSFSEPFTHSPKQLAAMLRSHLRESVRLRMRSDVPLGAFLSGGIDSSIVTALMDDVSDRPVETYTVGFEDAAYDEQRYAREVAEAFGTNHHEYVVTPDSIELLPELVEHFEVPFGDASAIPTYYISQAASDDLTVVLSGDGGDENFAGYDRYQWDRTVSRLRRIPRPLRKGGTSLLDRLPNALRLHTKTRHVREALDLAGRDSVSRYARFMSPVMDGDSERVFDGPGPTDDLARLRSAFEQSDAPDRLSRMMDVDISTYLPNDLLVKVDRASMAHSLEVRSPFLDHHLVQFAARIPANYKLNRGTSKWLLKRAFHEDLPERIVNREKKGFAVPLDDWFRDELRDFAHSSIDRLAKRDRFKGEELRDVLEAHQTGVQQNGYRIWNLLMLEGWYERFIDD